MWFYHPDLLCLWLMLIVLLNSGAGSRSHVRMGSIFPFCAIGLPTTSGYCVSGIYPGLWVPSTISVYSFRLLCHWYLSWVARSINHFCLRCLDIFICTGPLAGAVVSGLITQFRAHCRTWARVQKVPQQTLIFDTYHCSRIHMRMR